jgi:hypothetical protein
MDVHYIIESFFEQLFILRENVRLETHSEQ